MARPKSDRVSVRPVPSRRLTPFGAFYREWDATTKQRERRSRYFETEAAALAFAATKTVELQRVTGFLAKLPLQIAARSERVTVAQYIATFIATAAPRRKAATFTGYESMLRRHVVPVVGDVALSDFSADHAMLVATTAADGGYAWGMQRNILKALSACLTRAVRSKLLPANPVRGLMTEDLRDSNWIEPEPNPLTFDQQAAFLTWLQTGAVPAGYVPREEPGDRPAFTRKDERYPITRVVGGYRYYYAYFLLLLHTGVRRGEASAIAWERVFLDVKEPYVLIARTYSAAAQLQHRMGKRQYPADGMVATKTGRERMVSLSRALADVLREMRRSWRADAFRERRHLSSLIFTRPNSPRPVLAATVDRVFMAGMMAIGARHENHSVHGLRDTFATINLERGSPLAWVSAMLGHSKRSTTLDRYTKWIPQASAAGYVETLSRPPAAAPAAAVAGAPAPAAEPAEPRAGRLRDVSKRPRI